MDTVTVWGRNAGNKLNTQTGCRGEGGGACETLKQGGKNVMPNMGEWVVIIRIKANSALLAGWN